MYLELFPCKQDNRRVLAFAIPSLSSASCLQKGAPPPNPCPSLRNGGGWAGHLLPGGRFSAHNHQFVPGASTL